MIDRASSFTDRQARILIVDDERPNRQLLEGMLASAGYEIRMAAGGREALAMIDDERPDLILLDVMMPDMDGVDVAAELKNGLTTRNIPIVLVTGLDDRDVRLRGLTAGAEDFLTKPVDRAELSMRVRNLLRLKAYGDHFDQNAQVLEAEVLARTFELRQERDRAARYLSTADVFLLALDIDGRVTLANRYACEVLGWDEQELIGREWAESCLPERARAGFRGRFLRMLTGEFALAENPVLARSGVERLIEWRNTVLRDPNGHVTGTFSSGSDITDRTAAVEALQMANERTSYALEIANVGIWDVDYPTGATRWSPILESQYGLAPGEFGGTLESFIARIHPEDQAAARTALAEGAKSGADFSIHNRALLPDGSLRWLHNTGRFQLGSDGAPRRGVGISQDVTERRLLEAQHLQANKMEAVGQLAAGVAHDFNNLLTVISGFTELVGETFDAGSQNATDLQEVLKASKRATELTRQLLAFSRQQVLDPMPLDVNALITDMTRMLNRLIGADIAVSLVLAPGLAAALADRSQIEQVVMNLAVNARDAMPSGGTLTIETADADIENSSFHSETVIAGSYVMVSVTDTGAGMTKETERRLFEPFFTTKPTGKGTGLGLSTTYGIVKQSKGYIWVYSELGHGTTFRVYLPRAVGAAVAVAPTAVATAPAARPSETVLLVEDEPGVRDLARRILDRAGYRVIEADNGNDAERMYHSHAGAIAIVVTDVVMPGCGGPELVQRLLLANPALRYLYMSGYSEHTLIRLADLDRSRPVVHKPFTAAKLLSQLRETLDR
ncbi:MAG: response regulator [Acidobacteriota bacterium]|nr:response regulator [Acidobacteriota bacterium]